MPRHRLSPLPLLLFLVLIFGLAAGCDSDTASPPPEGTRPLTITNGAGQQRTIHVEVADDVAERNVGLSGRRKLVEDAGMLFVIPVRGPGFWMKDTYIPLSVAFIGPCGEIVHIADMEPETLEIHSTDKPYSFGLEVNQGWLARNGIAVGSVVDVPDDLRSPECVQGLSTSADKP